MFKLKIRTLERELNPPGDSMSIVTNCALNTTFNGEVIGVPLCVMSYNVLICYGTISKTYYTTRDCYLSIYNNRSMLDFNKGGVGYIKNVTSARGGGITTVMVA